MKKILNKKMIVLIIIVIGMLIGISSVFARSGLYLSEILTDIRNNLDSFLSRDYSYYYNKKVYVDVDEAIWEKDVTCFGHWYKTWAAEGNKVISSVIDLNLDGVNSIKVNGKKYTGRDDYIFQALAKSTSEGYNYQNYYNTAQDAATGKIIWDLINKGHISGFNGISASYGSNSPEKNWHEYYEECIAHGKDVANHVADGQVSCDKYNKELILSELVGKTDYLGPFQYSYTGEGNVTFSDIEIKGDNNFSDNIADLTGRLYVKSKNGYSNVKNGSIKPDTDFYISTNSNVDNSANIKVKINIKGVSCYKSRVLLIRAKNGNGGQSLAAYSTGAGKQDKSSQSLEYEFDNNRGNIQIHKSGEYTGKIVSKVEGIGFKVYYLDNNKKIYLTITDEIMTGTTTDANNATIIYTDKNGDAYVKRVDSRYKYYLEEITDKTDYSSNILKATQKPEQKDAKEVEVPIVSKGVAGPIDVKRQQEAKETSINLVDARKTGTLKILKQDYDKNNINISGVKFKVQNTETKQWVKAEGKDGVYNLKTYEDSFSKNKEYYKENYTSNENEATEFETNKNGQITINNIDVGTYIIKEVYIFNDNGNINYGYTEVDKPSEIDQNYVFWSTDGGKTKHDLAKEAIQLKVEDSNQTAESTIIVYNKKKYIKIRGYVWEDMLGGKDNNYETHGNNTFAQGDTLVEGISVRLKDSNGNIIKTTTTRKKDGAYEFADVSREAIEKGLYYVEFEYNGLTYTSVVPLVGNDSSVNSKAGEVVEERKKLNATFTEITNKDDINDRKNGYSRDASGNVTGTLEYENDTEKWYSTYKRRTYNNETQENVYLTANTNVSGYSLEKEFKEGRYTVDENNAFVIENVNLGMKRREIPQMAISNDIKSVEVDVNGYSHTYDYEQRNSFVENNTAFNVGVKFGEKYVSGYTRAIYPSDIQYSESDATDNKLKVYVTYVTTIRNLSNSLIMTANELVNYYDKNYTIVNSWVDDVNNKVTWNDTSKYGQKYDDSKFKASYSTGLAGIKINAGENKKVYVQFQVNDEAVRGLLSNKATLDNTMEIFSYSTYYGNDAEGCKTGDIYAGVDKVSAPGNAKMELDGENKLIKRTYEADTDSAPSLLLEAKGVRTIEGNVFEDKTSDELQSEKERKGDGIYDAGKENVISGVKVELLTTDGKAAIIYPNASDENGNPVPNTTGQEAVATTGADGYYIFKGIEPGTYFIRYTYANGTTKVFDMNGKEVKDINVQNYKSTIITSDTIKKAFENNESNLTWYKEKETRYSDARDNYEQRKEIDEEIKLIDGTAKTTINNLNADSPKFDLGVEYETIYTASTGDYYEYKVSDIDFGIVERPRQSATLDKVISNIKVTLPNGQVLVDGNPKNKLDYVTVTDDTVYITMDSELIYGSHLEIDYDLVLTNTSELDYISKNYYYYGIKEGDVVKFNRATLVDYVDKELTLKAGQNGNWTVLGNAEQLANKGYNWDLSKEQEEQLLKNFSTIVKAEPVSANSQIGPGESISSSIVVEKLLSTTDQELSYDNNGEVVTIGKTGGSIMTTKLGSYATLLAENPEEKPQEYDEDKALTTTIIPPTGATNHNVMYAIIGAVSLAILGVGTYGVRRFLKK